MPFLKVENLSQFYGKKQILKNISFDSNLGEVVAFLGPNGAGKTTLLRSVVGLTPIKDPNSKVYIDNNDATKDSVGKRVSQGLLYLPQQCSLFLKLTGFQNLKIVYENHDHWKNKSIDEFNAQMYKWLKKASITNVLSQKCYQLSGGQKRKLEIVRCLLMHPRAIMLDEPFAGVDPKSIYELKSIFVDLAKDGISIIISDHHVDQLLSISSRIYVVIAGEIIVSGGIKEIMENKYTKEMYLGRQFYSEISDRYLN